MTSCKLNRAPAQRGFTLIEILVTLVLVSVGLLGVAALQLTTLRGNQEAYVRSQASVLANDILDRMRANPMAFRAGEYDVDFDGTGIAGSTAGDDLLEWQRALDAALPGGEDVAAGRIVRTAGFPNVVTVTIRWRERPEGSGNDPALDEDEEDDPLLREFRTRSEI